MNENPRISIERRSISRKSLLSIVLAAALLSTSYSTWALRWNPHANAVVTIDGAKEFQTIDGFGGTEHYLPPKTEAEYSKIFDELGTSILRFRLFQYVEATPDMPGNEAENDNKDPFVIDWNGVQTKWFQDATTPIPALLKAAQSRGVKLFGNIMTPPPWMKTNNADSGMGPGGVTAALKAGYEDELVEFILIWIKGLERDQGVHIDYVNFESEPNFPRTYEGCYLRPEQIQDLTRRLGTRMASEHITTQIVPPETSNLTSFQSWAPTICGDTTARSYISRLSTHSYNIDFFDPDKNNSDWTKSYNLAAGFGIPLWLTEYCLDSEGYKGTWREAITLVQHVHDALYYGNVSAWLYHEIYSDPSKTPLALIDPDPRNPGGMIVYPKFYALKQYFHYIRPGAVRIQAESDNGDILVTSFVHKRNKDFNIVAINRQTYDQPVVFNMKNVQFASSLDVVRTSAAENAAGLGRVSVADNSFSYILPGQSVTTFSAAISTPTAAYFPHIAVGGGYSTAFTLINAGDSTFHGDLVLTGQGGEPLPVTFSGAWNLTGPSCPVSLAPGGTANLVASSVGVADPLRVGWGRVDGLSSVLSGVATFQLRENGALRAYVGVLSSQATNVATIPVDDDGINRLTGFAVANPGDQDVYIGLVPIREDGTVLSAVYPKDLNPLNPQKQFAGYVSVSGYIQTPFKGSVVLVSQDGRQFLALGLAQNEGQYSAVPVISSKPSNVSY